VVILLTDPLRSLLLMLLHVLPHQAQRTIRREGLVAIRSDIAAIQMGLISAVQLERTRCVAPIRPGLLLLLLLHEVREIAVQLTGD